MRSPTQHIQFHENIVEVLRLRRHTETIKENHLRIYYRGFFFFFLVSMHSKYTKNGYTLKYIDVGM